MVMWQKDCLHVIERKVQFSQSLMHLYLTRPDLVEGTDRMVQQQQTKLDDIKAPIHHDPTLVEKVADRPVEPTM